jgi:PEP-CTERM motif-containing protein
MKRIAALFIFLTVFSVIAALANSAPDPRIIIKDPVCGSNCTSVGTHFTFTSPASGSGALLFTNASDSSWHNLEFIESGVPASDITCSAPHTFMNCNVTTTNGVTKILLSGIGTGFDGILVNHNFEISFAGWPTGGVHFTAIANVPEPATLALLLTGLGALATRRKSFLHRN